MSRSVVIICLVIEVVITVVNYQAGNHWTALFAAFTAGLLTTRWIWHNEITR